MWVYREKQAIQEELDRLLASFSNTMEQDLVTGEVSTIVLKDQKSQTHVDLYHQQRPLQVAQQAFYL
jgi:hypothetical protein